MSTLDYLRFAPANRQEFAMPHIEVMRRFPLWVFVATLSLAPAALHAQATKKAKPAPSAVFTDALRRAKETNQPLVIFGMTEGCSRCVAFKQGLAAQPELQQLLASYVSTEVPFGGRDFVAIYEEIVRQDVKYRHAIGGPSVFIFTAKGNVVYSGPNDANGMQAGDEFKKLLLTGIEKSGGPRIAAKAATTTAASAENPPPKSAARQWKSKNGFSVTATLVSFDGTSAKLRTEAGNTISVALDALSAEDQQFLKTERPQ
jgi:hypothetical protein